MDADEAMTRLTLYRDDAPQTAIAVLTEPAEIAASLAEIGVGFERWQATKILPPDASQDAVLTAYETDIDRLMRDGAYRSADVVRLQPDHPDRAALRRKFLDEHIHAEDEVRFFVAGSGAFYLRAGGHVRQVVCVAGDLLRVPAGTKHWFDMGPLPSFAAIRIFTNPDGWVGQFTGDTIASRFPLYELHDAA
jgi:1,2-dihydroxy-3-keto-5-methylthiopentene dioxygenase